MLYQNDFVIQNFNGKPLFVNRNAFTVTLNNNTAERKTTNRYSLAHALKPLVFFSSIFALNAIKYSKYGINKLNILNKFYCIVIIATFVPFTAFIRSINWHQVDADLPFNIIRKIFLVSQCFEVFYDIFIVSFGNGNIYIKLIRSIDSIDDHFIITKRLFIKRRIYAIVLVLIPFFLTSFTFLFLKFELLNILDEVSFTIILLQGVNCFFFASIIYTRLLNFNTILLKKVGNISSSKKFIFKNDLLANVINKMFSDPVHKKFNNGYCWFELMQIYDKISDCIYLFNKIYAGQIFLMFNEWLLSTLLAICRSISPIYKNNHEIRADLYFYAFSNLRPLLITGISERLIQERKKTLLILEHILIYHDLDPEYRSQVKTMLSLVQTRQLELSAIVCSVNLPVMITFTGRIVSYTVLMIQNFYIKLLLKN